jgi:hypothetical protein
MTGPRTRKREAHPAASRAARASRSRQILVLIAVAAAAAAIAEAWTLHTAHRNARPPTAMTAREREIAALPAAVAYDSALALATRRHALESLAYYRRAIRGMREDFWQLHCDYSTALYNLTLELGTRRGVVVSRTRASLERTALLREAIRQLGIAQRLTRRPQDRAVVIGRIGQLMQVYGFPWETFVAYREAQFADPGDPTLRTHANGFQRMLEHPTAPDAVRPDTSARVER